MLPSMEALEHRRVYRIHCRNLTLGVWHAERKGFIGIREKFGSKYLFMEYHHDASPTFGTVNGAEALEAWIPACCHVEESLPDSLCDTCLLPVEWGGPPAPAPWRHKEEEGLPQEHEITPRRFENATLFRLLDHLERRLHEQEGP